MWQLLFFIILILLIQGLSKILEKETNKKEPKEEIEKYFETLGFPTIRIPPKKEKPPKLEEKKMEAQPPIIKEERPVLKEKISEIKEEISPLFPPGKLEEGIILSEILGPPKASRIRRGGEIGRHARLKIS